MQEQNIHIIERQNNTFWFENSPVTLRSVSLFKDLSTNQLFVTATLQNVQASEIYSADVKIICYDTARNHIGEDIIYTYSQLFCKRGDLFGEAFKIKIPNKYTRFVDVILISTSNCHGAKWKNTSEQKFETCLAQENIYTALGKYYPIFHDICKENGINPEPLMLEPQFYDSYWLCACGNLSWSFEDKCVCCHCSRQFLSKYIKPENLESRFQSMDKAEKRRYEEIMKDWLKSPVRAPDARDIRRRNAGLRKQRNRWIMKKVTHIAGSVIVIIAIIAVLFILGYWAYTSFIQPYISEYQAGNTSVYTVDNIPTISDHLRFSTQNHDL